MKAGILIFAYIRWCNLSVSDSTVSQCDANKEEKDVKNLMVKMIMLFGRCHVQWLESS